MLGEEILTVAYPSNPPHPSPWQLQPKHYKLKSQKPASGEDKLRLNRVQILSPKPGGIHGSDSFRLISKTSMNPGERTQQKSVIFLMFYTPKRQIQCYFEFSRLLFWIILHFSAQSFVSNYNYSGFQGLNQEKINLIFNEFFKKLVKKTPLCILSRMESHILMAPVIFKLL